ncbi:MAG: DUF4286 family protein [Bacteroidales bacterium]
MIIYNTTYQVDPSIHDEAINWIKESLIPSLLKTQHLKNPRFVKVLTDDPNNNSYSLQFEVDSIADLNAWYKQVGAEIYSSLTNKYGNKLLGFTTLLENIEL